MTETLLVQMAGVAVLGVLAQWLAWRLKLPGILLLLFAGFLAGPITGFLHTDELLGELLFPFVSIAVGVILFEGGLSLRVSELRQVGNVIRNLITVGVVITWVLTTLAALIILQLDFILAVQLGAILVVTGPTVIGPLLRFVRPTGTVASILRWEGILIDPVGATLALLVFEFIHRADPSAAAGSTVLAIVMTLIVGGVVGYFSARALVYALRRYWVPDYLQNAIILMAVIGAFALSNVLQHESGLLTTTIMGIVLANQKYVPIRRIIEFKENVGVLLISSLFILLAARLRLEDLTVLGWESLVFLAALILVVRPASVWLSTLNSTLTWRERVFLMWMAPRGIVAASVSSVFALGLVESGYPQAEQLVPLTFLVIVGTCLVYGLTALPLARRLGLSQPSPQGMLIVGAHPWAVALADTLRSLGQDVIMIDTNHENIQSAQGAGLDTHYGSVLAEELDDELNLQRIGRLLALTSNDEVNSLAALRLSELFGQARVYQLPYKTDNVVRDLHGRILFSPEANFRFFQEHFSHGGTFQTIRLTLEYDFAVYQEEFGSSALPLFLIDEANGKSYIFTLDDPIFPQPGHLLVSFIKQSARSTEQNLIQVAANSGR